MVLVNLAHVKVHGKLCEVGVPSLPRSSSTNPDFLSPRAIANTLVRGKESEAPEYQ